MTTLPVPPRSRIRAVLETVWQMLVGGVRFFVVDTLREGAIDLRPLSPALRVLTVVGLVLVYIFLGSILFNGILRQTGSLERLQLDSGSARGLFIPTLAAPLTLFALTLAWAFILTGALYVRAAVKWFILFLFLFFGFFGTFTGTSQALGVTNSLYPLASNGLVLALLLGLVLLYWRLPRVRADPAFAFVVMAFIVGALFLFNFFVAAQAEAVSDIPFSNFILSTMLSNTQVLIVPFLLIAGSEMANFGITFSGWIARSAERFALRSVVIVLLVALLAFRLGEWFLNVVLPGIPPDQWLRWAGAGLTGLGLAVIAWWRHTKPASAPLPGRLLVGIIVGLLLFNILMRPLTQLSSFIVILNPLMPNGLALQNQLLDVLGIIEDWYGQFYILLIAVVGLVIAWLALRRGQYTIAAFGMILAWTQGVWVLMASGRPLETWRYTYDDMDELILFALIAIAISLRARNQLTARNAVLLFGLAVLNWVLLNTSFLDNPFSPLFAFTGVFFLVFGILWNVLTVGGNLTNYDTPHFPRAARVLLYLGYVLLTLSFTHWNIVSHNLTQQSMQNDLTTTGYRIFGLALAYLVFAEGGRALLESDDAPRQEAAQLGA